MLILRLLKITPLASHWQVVSSVTHVGVFSLQPIPDSTSLVTHHSGGQLTWVNSSSSSRCHSLPESELLLHVKLWKGNSSSNWDGSHQGSTVCSPVIRCQRLRGSFRLKWGCVVGRCGQNDIDLERGNWNSRVFHSDKDSCNCYLSNTVEYFEQLECNHPFKINWKNPF